MSVANMTTKQWYRILIENNVTMQVQEGSVRELIPVKCEVKNPLVNWDRTWSYTLMPGLGSEQKTFLFKMLHNILPTKARLFRLQQSDSPICSQCTSGNSEDCAHALLSCSFNTEEVNRWIRQVVNRVAPNINLQDIVTLNLDLDQTSAFPMVWFLSHTLSIVWQLRSSKKNINLHIIRASLEAKINFLRKSRLSSRCEEISDMIYLL